MTTRFKAYTAACFLMVLLLTLTLMFSRYFVWWGEGRLLAGIFIDNAALGLLPVMVTSAFWAAQLRRRQMVTLERVTPAGARMAAYRIVSVAASGMGALLVAFAISAVANYTAGPMNQPPVAWLLPSLLGAFLLSGVGYLLGPIFRWPALVLLLGPLGWVILGLAVASDYTSGLITLQASAAAEAPFTAPFIAIQALWLGTLGAIVFVLATRSWINTGVMVVLVATAVGAGGWLVALDPNRRQTLDLLALAPVCKPLTPQVEFCTAYVEGPLAGTLSEWSAQVVETSGPLARHVRLIATDRAARVLVPARRDMVGSDVAIVSPRYGFEQAMLPVRADTVAPLLAIVINPRNCPLVSEVGDTTMGQVLKWMLNAQQLNGPPATVDSSAGATRTYQTLESLSDRDRLAWLSANAEAIQACRPV